MNDEPVYDLCVIGGGINGAGIARDAAGRGLKVLLLEKGDLACATSSASTKLVHGGLRYLEFFEFKLVRESLKEREILLKIAPHIVHPMEFVLPHHADLRPQWMIRAGLFLYDFLAGSKKLKSSRAIRTDRHPYGVPLQKKYKRAFTYADCRVHDARLVVLNALDAARMGADVLTRTACVSLRDHPGGWHVGYRRDDAPEDGTEATISYALCRAVVNACGPWVGSFLQDIGLAAPAGTQYPHVRLVKGSHIIVPRRYDGEQAYILQQKDGRIVFAIPYEQNFTLIGTTEEEFDADPAEAKISEAEKNYLCAAHNNFFEEPISPSDIVWSFSGVRPLYDDGRKNARAVTRDYRLFRHKTLHPMISVYGGKLTTYRHLSQQVVDTIAQTLEHYAPGWTHEKPLPGGDLPHPDITRILGEYQAYYAWMPEDLLRRYVFSYGTCAEEIIGAAEDVSGLGEHYGDHIYEAEINYLMRSEWARTAEDVLWRRSWLGLRAQDFTRENIDRAMRKKGENRV